MQCRAGILLNIEIGHFRLLLQLKPFRFMDNYINVPERIAMHLTLTFYNLTTITPQDWAAYTAMKFSRPGSFWDYANGQ